MKTFDRFMTCLTTGTLITALELIFGKCDRTLIVLLVCMFFDLITGVLCGVKEEKLSSNICFNGLKRKLFILIYVIIGNQLDLLLQVDYIRIAVCSMYIVNEIISIIENGTLLGVPVPKPIQKVLEIINDKKEGE